MDLVSLSRPILSVAKMGYMFKVKMASLAIIEDDEEIVRSMPKLVLVDDDEILFNPKLTLFNGVKCDGKMCGMGKYSGGWVCPHNNLKIMRPDLMLEWDFDINTFNPSLLAVRSHKKVWWKCTVSTCDHHKWSSPISDRTGIKKSGCPFCSSRRTCVCNSIQTKRKDLMLEWDFEKNILIDPSNTAVGSDKKVWWKCKHDICGHHRWLVSISNRTKGKNGCPFCSNQRTCECNSLKTKRPDLMIEWDFEKNILIDPSKTAVGSDKKVWWKCKNSNCEHHVWQALISSRKGIYGSGCPFCSKHKVCICNSISNLRPDLMLEWDFEKNKDEDPTTISLKSSKKVWWKCTDNPCGHHSWEAIIYSRSAGNGCPFCSIGNKTCPCDSLEIKRPDLMSEWDFEKNADLNPSTIATQSNKKVWWKCKNTTCQHAWSAVIASRTQGSGCPRCRPSGYSKAQIAWLQQIEQEQGITIQHAESENGEFYINNIGKVDGYHPTTNTVFEYHGDFWHASPLLFHPHDINPVSKKTYGDLYRATLKRDQAIRDLGFNLIIEWEGDDPTLDTSKWVCTHEEMFGET